MNLSKFNTANLFEASNDLFNQLGINLNSNTKEQLPVRDLLKQHFRETEIFNAIDRTFFIGIIDDSVFRQTGLFDESYSYKDAMQHADKSYEGLMFFALELAKQPTRTEISELTRAFNRISQKMPVALLLKYNVSPPSSEAVISIAISERFKYKQNWRQGEKAGKVIILRDIHTQSLHSGHERILLDLVKPVAVTNYEQLHAHWLQALDVSILNKKFFQELANWYFWAMDNVQFPDDIEKKKEIRNATNLIRLITRIIFIWFIKEKKLVPANLFRKDSLNRILKDFAIDDKSGNYYKAILQNLFFGTLNQRMDDRGFVVDGTQQQNKNEYGVKNLFRHSNKFNLSETEVIQLFKDVPFLNGGLFDCLDKPDDAGTILYVDGFSRNPKKQASVPDFLFFGEPRDVDLTSYYDPKAKKPIIRNVKGLMLLLESYKFTVAENTPIEEEIALDPELLGKVFENLLASYNPETQTTARKQTGSFYTPREIVNYMADESLMEYLKLNCKDFSDLEKRLRNLFSYCDLPTNGTENLNPFNEKETRVLIKAINNCKILDPACGSGAYPMGVLHKMVHILTKLDPDNTKWKAEQEEKIIGEKIKELEKDKTAIDGLSDVAVKEKANIAVEERLKEIKEIFESENNFDDYSRKLFLIENCIYGVDIQPIAVQISKLRFFISLIIDQNKQEGEENLGIRSLPNLETKFVAADSLNGLDKPQQGRFRNLEIEEKENQLKALRHSYFTAKTRKEKMQYQLQDKKLRSEIARLLENDGWNTIVAKQIVAFDPYDQNLSAPFFESEWMFGLTEGFDIVIGNPPYVQVAKGLYSSNLFPFSEGKDKGKQNLYKLFVEVSYNLAKPNAVGCMIVQSSLMCDQSSTFTRELLISKTQIKKVIEYPKKSINSQAQVFDSVLQGTCTYLFIKSIPDSSCEVNISINNDTSTIPNLIFESINQLSLLKLYPETYYLPLISKDDAKVIEKIYLNSHPFSHFIKSINQGDLNLATNAAQFSELKTPIKLYRGRNIHRYEILKDVTEFVNEDFLIEKVKENQKYTYIVLQEITGTTDKFRLHACLTDKSEKFLFGHTANKILLKDTSLNKCCMAILNSNLLDWFFRKTSTNNHVMGYEIKQLPFFKELKKDQKAFNIIVDFIIQLKKSKKDSSFFDRLLDAMVYEMYLPEAIQIGGAEVLKYVSDLTGLIDGADENNLQTIEVAYKKFSDPNHPVSAALLKLLNIEEINIIEGKK